MKKSQIFIFLLTIFILFVFTGCEPKNSGNSNPTATLESTASPTPDPKVFTDSITNVTPDPSKHLSVTVNDEGYDIHSYPEDLKWSYRYGPSMMQYPDGSMDSWFAATGSQSLGEWDWFTYKHSTDSGTTWSDEIVVLQPTADSIDFYSVCDPGVIYFGGYYYMGYTSTIYKSGLGNNGYVARSKTPDGPYEKWNGTGWGGDPSPIVYFTDNKNGWGAGEMSFVELNGKLYVYYTWHTENISTTRVSLADATNENWPLTMQYQGVAATRDNEMDSLDVKYVEDYGKFIAISAGKVRTPESYICIWESNDGLTFTLVNKLYTNIIYYCHNAGLMSRPNGHIKLSDKLYFGYAYGGTSNEWGKWATRVHSFSLSLVDEPNFSDAVEQNNRKVDVVNSIRRTDLWPIAISTKTHNYKYNLKEGTFELTPVWIDTYCKDYDITDANLLTFSDYDTSIISIDGLNCTPNAVGQTSVTMKYMGRSIIFKVTILADEIQINKSLSKIVLFKPSLFTQDGPIKLSAVDNTITLSNSNRSDKMQLRIMTIFENGNWMEFSNDNTSDAVHFSRKIVYSSSDKSIVRVDQKGMLTPLKLGTATITVTCGDSSCEVTVNVVA